MPDFDAEVWRVVRDYRAALESHDAEATRLLTERYLMVEDALEDKIVSLSEQIKELADKGETSVWRIYELERYQRLQMQLVAELAKYNADAARIVASAQGIAIDDAATSAAAMLTAGAPEGYYSALDLTLNMTDWQQLGAMIGNTADGTPLARLMDEVNAKTRAAVDKALTKSTALGRNPKVTAAEIRRACRMPLQRALLISRTEQLRVARETSALIYRKAGVTQYERVCSYDDRTCIACIAADGDIYDSNVILDDHPNGRCTTIPIIPDPNDPNTNIPFQRQAATEWFRKQDVFTQQQMMGPTRWALWKQNYACFKELATHTTDPVWGGSVKLTPIRELMAEATGKLDSTKGFAREKMGLKLDDYHHLVDDDGKPYATSLDRWIREDGTLDPVREARHERIVERFCSDRLPSQEHPLCQRVGGASASGKSTMKGNGQIDVMGDDIAAQIDADEVKKMLPEYENMLAGTDEEIEQAAAFVHEESSYIAKLIEARALERKVNYVTDGVNDGKLSKCIEQIKRAQELGYRVEGFFATVPTSKALEWATKRAKRTKRKVPEKYIKGAHENVSEIFPELAPYFDECVLFDNWSDGKGVSTLVARAVRGEPVEVVDEALWRAFLTKSAVFRELERRSMDTRLSRYGKDEVKALRKALAKGDDAQVEKALDGLRASYSAPADELSPEAALALRHEEYERQLDEVIGKMIADGELPPPGTGFGEAPSLLDPRNYADGQLTPERREEYKTIIRKMVPEKLEPQEVKRAQMLGGGTASGKSTTVESGRVSIMGTDEAALINADDAKEMLHDYNELMARGEYKEAANHVHEESSFLYKAAQRLAMRRDLNFVIDGTNDGGIKSAIKKVDLLKDPKKMADQVGCSVEDIGRAYRVEGVFCSLSQKQAFANAEFRAAGASHRWVNPLVSEGNHTAISGMFEDIAGHYDDIVLYDNEIRGVPRMVARCTAGGRIEVVDEELWTAFLRKSAKADGRRRVAAGEAEDVVQKQLDDELALMERLKADPFELSAGELEKVVDGYGLDDAARQRLRNRHYAAREAERKEQEVALLRRLEGQTDPYGMSLEDFDAFLASDDELRELERFGIKVERTGSRSAAQHNYRTHTLNPRDRVFYHHEMGHAWQDVFYRSDVPEASDLINHVKETAALYPAAEAGSVQEWEAFAYAYDRLAKGGKWKLTYDDAKFGEAVFPSEAALSAHLMGRAQRMLGYSDEQMEAWVAKQAKRLKVKPKELRYWQVEDRLGELTRKALPTTKDIARKRLELAQMRFDELYARARLAVADELPRVRPLRQMTELQARTWLARQQLTGYADAFVSEAAELLPAAVAADAFKRGAREIQAALRKGGERDAARAWARAAKATPGEPEDIAEGKRLMEAFDRAIDDAPMTTEETTVFRYLSGDLDEVTGGVRLREGDSFVHHGYLSTTLHIGDDVPREAVVLDITVDRGERGLAMDVFSDKREYELLLGRGRTLEVVGDRYVDDAGRLHLPVRLVRKERAVELPTPRIAEAKRVDSPTQARAELHKAREGMRLTEVEDLDAVEGEVVWRGFKGTADVPPEKVAASVDHFLSDPRGGLYSELSGAYVTTGPRARADALGAYASGDESALLKMKLAPDAKVIEEAELKELIGGKPYSGELGYEAWARGYDAIKMPDALGDHYRPIYVVLNPEKLLVEARPVREAFTVEALKVKGPVAELKGASKAAQDTGTLDAFATIHDAARGFDEAASVADSLGGRYADGISEATVKKASREVTKASQEALVRDGFPEEFVVYRVGDVSKPGVVRVSTRPWRPGSGVKAEDARAYVVRREDVLTYGEAVQRGTFAEDELHVLGDRLRLLDERAEVKPLVAPASTAPTSAASAGLDAVDRATTRLVGEGLIQPGEQRLIADILRLPEEKKLDAFRALSDPQKDAYIRALEYVKDADSAIKREAEEALAKRGVPKGVAVVDEAPDIAQEVKDDVVDAFVRSLGSADSELSGMPDILFVKGGADPFSGLAPASWAPGGSREFGVVTVNVQAPCWSEMRKAMDDAAASTSGPTYSTSELDHFLVHELMHAAQEQSMGWSSFRTLTVRGMTQEQADAALKELTALWKAHPEIGMYAGLDSPVEFLAEIATGMKFGKTYTDDVMDVYRRYGGIEVKPAVPTPPTPFPAADVPREMVSDPSMFSVGDELSEAEAAWVASLSDDEVEALKAYTKEGGHPTPEQLEVVGRAIERAPVVEEVTYRGITTPFKSAEMTLDDFRAKVGEVIEWKGLSSTSLNPALAVQHAKGGATRGIIFEVRSRRGRYISDASANDDEAEVLLNNARLRVVGVEKVQFENEYEELFDHWVVQLEEVVDEVPVGAAAPAAKAIDVSGRAGHCYREAARAVKAADDGSMLIHGSVVKPDGKRILHAWVEKPDGSVYDATLDRAFTRAEWETIQPIEYGRFTRAEALMNPMPAKFGHMGPWAGPDSDDAARALAGEAVAPAKPVSRLRELDIELPDKTMAGLVDELLADGTLADLPMRTGPKAAKAAALKAGKKYSSGTDEGDRFLAEVQKRRGFDAKPEVVDELGPDDVGEFDLYRGVSTREQGEAFIDGELFPSTGMWGDGTYFTYHPKDALHTAASYGDHIVHAALAPNAVIMDYDEVATIAKRASRTVNEAIIAAKKAGATKEQLDELMRIEYMVRDPGRVAALLGADAMNVPRGPSFMVVFNRGKVKVERRILDAKAGELPAIKKTAAPGRSLDDLGLHVADEQTASGLSRLISSPMFDDYVQMSDRKFNEALVRSKNGDDALFKLREEHGFNASTEVVDELPGDGIELWRGVGSVEHAEAWRTGDCYAGFGTYGDGTYFYAGRNKTLLQDIADEYAGDSIGSVIHAELLPTARTVELKKLAKDVLEPLDEAVDGAIATLGKTPELKRLQVLLRDPGRVATMMGYDAIFVTRSAADRTVIVLNRAATVTQRALDPDYVEAATRVANSITGDDIAQAKARVELLLAGSRAKLKGALAKSYDAELAKVLAERADPRRALIDAALDDILQTGQKHWRPMIERIFYAADEKTRAALISHSKDSPMMRAYEEAARRVDEGMAALPTAAPKPPTIKELGIRPSKALTKEDIDKVDAFMATDDYAAFEVKKTLSDMAEEDKGAFIAAGGSKHEGDRLLPTILKATGGDAKPELVDNLPTFTDELRDLTTSKTIAGRPIFRGVTSPKYADDFREGDVFASTGIHGSGPYFALSEATAEEYVGMSGGEVIRAVIKPTARIANEHELSFTVSKLRDSVDKRIFETLEELKAKGIGVDDPRYWEAMEPLRRAEYLLRDQGKVAALLGYDAVYIPSKGFVTILNRGCLIVERRAAGKTALKKLPGKKTPAELREGVLVAKAKGPLHGTREEFEAALAKEPLLDDTAKARVMQAWDAEEVLRGPSPAYALPEMVALRDAIKEGKKGADVREAYMTAMATKADRPAREEFVAKLGREPLLDEAARERILLEYDIAASGKGRVTFLVERASAKQEERILMQLSDYAGGWTDDELARVLAAPDSSVLTDAAKERIRTVNRLKLREHKVRIMLRDDEGRMSLADLTGILHRETELSKEAKDRLRSEWMELHKVAKREQTMRELYVAKAETMTHAEFAAALAEDPLLSKSISAQERLLKEFDDAKTAAALKAKEAAEAAAVEGRWLKTLEDDEGGILALSDTVIRDTLESISSLTPEARERLLARAKELKTARFSKHLESVAERSGEDLVERAARGAYSDSAFERALSADAALSRPERAELRARLREEFVARREAYIAEEKLAKAAKELAESEARARKEAWAAKPLSERPPVDEALRKQLLKALRGEQADTIRRELKYAVPDEYKLVKLGLLPKNYDSLPVSQQLDLLDAAKAKFVDQRIASALDSVAKATDGVPVSVRVKGSDAKALIDDGRFKTQFETHTSNGYLDTTNHARRHNEAEGFGYSAHLDPTLRPVYGYVDVGDNFYGASQYGDMSFQFGDSVRSRTTISWIDSLGSMGDGYLRPAPLVEPDVGMFHRGAAVEEAARGADAVVERFKGWGSYLEAQIHGGLPLSEATGLTYHFVDNNLDFFHSHLAELAAGTVDITSLVGYEAALKFAVQNGLDIHFDVVRGGTDFSAEALQKMVDDIAKQYRVNPSRLHFRIVETQQ